MLGILSKKEVVIYTMAGVLFITAAYTITISLVLLFDKLIKYF